ncbi:hypothetical protein DFQ27_007549 [Actinomortierella ambigua]|uniref:Uncharacterized protein n=1 Tax=Actinomortierella ambigua TaxID=1343610 RepID=A0A9P6UC85_9FUNG|nr:hypothetical protein DFQ27_007549 [Actinomortierella ambigua]
MNLNTSIGSSGNHPNAGAREGAVLERQDQPQKRSTGGPTNSTNSNGGGGGASWFGSLRGLVIAGSSASRGAFSPLTMDDDKDRHSDSEHEDDNEENDEGATYRAPRWAWSMLDPSQLGRTLLAPLYQSVPASAAAADVEEHQRSEGLDENEVETRQDQRPRRYNVVQH